MEQKRADHKAQLLAMLECIPTTEEEKEKESSGGSLEDADKGDSAQDAGNLKDYLVGVIDSCVSMNLNNSNATPTQKTQEPPPVLATSRSASPKVQRSPRAQSPRSESSKMEDWLKRQKFTVSEEYLKEARRYYPVEEELMRHLVQAEAQVQELRRKESQSPDSDKLYLHVPPVHLEVYDRKVNVYELISPDEEVEIKARLLDLLQVMSKAFFLGGNNLREDADQKKAFLDLTGELTRTTIRETSSANFIRLRSKILLAVSTMQDLVAWRETAERRKLDPEYTRPISEIEEEEEQHKELLSIWRELMLAKDEFEQAKRFLALSPCSAEEKEEQAVVLAAVEASEASGLNPRFRRIGLKMVESKKCFLEAREELVQYLDSAGDDPDPTTVLELVDAIRAVKRPFEMRVGRLRTILHSHKGLSELLNEIVELTSAPFRGLASAHLEKLDAVLLKLDGSAPPQTSIFGPGEPVDIRAASPELGYYPKYGPALPPHLEPRSRSPTPPPASVRKVFQATREFRLVPEDEAIPEGVQVRMRDVKNWLIEARLYDNFPSRSASPVPSEEEPITPEMEQRLRFLYILKLSSEPIDEDWKAAADMAADLEERQKAEAEAAEIVREAVNKRKAQLDAEEAARQAAEDERFVEPDATASEIEAARELRAARNANWAPRPQSPPIDKRKIRLHELNPRPRLVIERDPRDPLAWQRQTSRLEQLGIVMPDSGIGRPIGDFPNSAGSFGDGAFGPCAGGAAGVPGPGPQRPTLANATYGFNYGGTDMPAAVPGGFQDPRSVTTSNGFAGPGQSFDAPGPVCTGPGSGKPKKADAVPVVNAGAKFGSALRPKNSPAAATEDSPAAGSGNAPAVVPENAGVANGEVGAGATGSSYRGYRRGRGGRGGNYRGDGGYRGGIYRGDGGYRGGNVGNAHWRGRSGAVGRGY